MPRNRLIALAAALLALLVLAGALLAVVIGASIGEAARTAAPHTEPAATLPA